jgi:hypothetical protein
MCRLDQAWLAFCLSVRAVLPAHAQVTIDVSKITREQCILYTVANPHEIAIWLSGYYNDKRATAATTAYPKGNNSGKGHEHGTEDSRFCVGV